MTRTVRNVLGVSFAMLGALAPACANDSDGPGAATSLSPPSLRVEVVGWGNARDPDGFVVTVGSRTAPVPWNGAATIKGLPPSFVTVTLDGVATHCNPDPGPHSVTLAVGRSDTVRIAVGCFGDFAFVEQQPNLEWRLRYLDTLGGIRTLVVAAGRQVPGEWAPGGDRIAYTTNERSPRLLSNVTNPDFDLAVVNLAGGAPVWLATDPAGDFWPRWSPNGADLVYNRWYLTGSRLDSAAVHLVRVDGTGDRALLAPSAFDLDPAWVQGGTRIAFGCQRFYYLGGICLTASTGGDVTALVPALWNAQHVVASPQRDWIAFMAVDAVYQSIYTVGVAGGPLTRLGHQGLPTFDKVWSPDGSRLAVQTLEAPNVYGVRTVEPSGSNLSGNLIPFSTNVATVSWSPEGNWLAVSAVDPTGQHIYVLRSDGSGVRQVTFGPLTTFLAKWRPGSHFTPPPGWAGMTPAPVFPGVRAPIFGGSPGGARQCFGMVGTVSGPIPCDRTPR